MLVDPTPLREQLATALAKEDKLEARERELLVKIAELHARQGIPPLGLVWRAERELALVRHDLERARSNVHTIRAEMRADAAEERLADQRAHDRRIAVTALLVSIFTAVATAVAALASWLHG